MVDAGCRVGGEQRRLRYEESVFPLICPIQRDVGRNEGITVNTGLQWQDAAHEVVKKSVEGARKEADK